MVWMSVYNKTFNPHAFSQLLWKARFGEWLIFIPLWEFQKRRVETVKTGLF